MLLQVGVRFMEYLDFWSVVVCLLWSPRCLIQLLLLLYNLHPLILNKLCRLISLRLKLLIPLHTYRRTLPLLNNHFPRHRRLYIFFVYCGVVDCGVGVGGVLRRLARSTLHFEQRALPFDRAHVCGEELCVEAF